MKTIVIGSRQCLLDVAMQYAGNAEAAFDVALLNNIALTDQLPAGNNLLPIKPVNKEVVQLMATENHKPATAVDMMAQQEGIGFWRIKIDFTIS